MKFGIWVGMAFACIAVGIWNLIHYVAGLFIPSRRMKREKHCSPLVTLETCQAIQFTFEPDGLTTVICWKGKPSQVKPPDGKRIRDIQPGDEVILSGELAVVKDVLLYR